MLVIDDYIKDENLLSLIRNDKKLFPDSMGFDEGIGSRLNQYHEPGAKVFALTLHAAAASISERPR
jgi:hypothetical protein